MDEQAQNPPFALIEFRVSYAARTGEVRAAWHRAEIRRQIGSRDGEGGRDAGAAIRDGRR